MKRLVLGIGVMLVALVAFSSSFGTAFFVGRNSHRYVATEIISGKNGKEAYLLKKEEILTPDRQAFSVKVPLNELMDRSNRTAFKLNMVRKNSGKIIPVYCRISAMFSKVKKRTNIYSRYWEKAPQKSDLDYMKGLVSKKGVFLVKMPENARGYYEIWDEKGIGDMMFCQKFSDDEKERFITRYADKKEDDPDRKTFMVGSLSSLPEMLGDGKTEEHGVVLNRGTERAVFFSYIRLKELFE